MARVYVDVPVRNRDTDEKSWIRIYEDEPVPILASGFEVMDDKKSVKKAQQILHTRQNRARRPNRLQGSVLLYGRG